MGKLVSYRSEAKPLPNQFLLMYRQRSGLTQEQLAVQLGLKSGRMVQKWESGETVPTAVRLQNLLKFYLAAGIFVPGKELEEARRLWQAVKDMFDQTTATYETYPIFDEVWFAQLLGKQNQVEGQEQLSGISRLVSANQSSIVNRQSTIALNPNPPPLTAKNNLPIPPNRLIGREDEVKAVKALLSAKGESNSIVRLLTLTGAGGTGKTRLAIQVASELVAEFEQIWFVPLAPVQEAELVAFTVVKTIGLKEQPGFETAKLLQNFLTHKRALLVLDNFEHLLAAHTLVSELLQNCPKLVLLVTSRVALRISREHEFPVAPLKLPPKLAQKNISTTAFEQQYAALTLFVERAQAVKPSFELDAGNSAAVVKICQRLDGLPLAIELAAAWIKMLSPPNLLACLVDEQAYIKLKMLNTGGVDLPERQQTIMASIQWSYNLLSRAEQILLQRLSIFSGGWELAVAEEICAGDGLEHSDILYLLYQLVNHSLVVVEEVLNSDKATSQPRFRLLETIRQFSWEQLQLSGEVVPLQDRYLAYYLKLSEEAEEVLMSSTIAATQIRERLTREIANIRAALTLSLATNTSSEKVVSGLRITAALLWFWMRFGLVEGRRWLELALEKLPEQFKATPNEWYAKGLMRTGHIAIYLNDYQAASKLCNNGLELYRALNCYSGMSESLIHLSAIVNHFRQQAHAITLAEEALALAEKTDNTQLLAWAHARLARVAYRKDSYTKSLYHYEKAISLKQSVHDFTGIALYQDELGFIATDQKDYAKARALFQQSWQLYYDTADVWGLIILLESGLAKLAVATAKFELVPLLLGTAETMREDVGWLTIENAGTLQSKFLEIARVKLGDQKVAKLYEQGRHLTPEQMIAIWQQTLSIENPVAATDGQPSTVKPEKLDSLTRRELEVLRLLANGLTNAQIAAELHLSPRTVNTHLTAIFSKIAVNSRSAATHYAFEHKLL